MAARVLDIIYRYRLWPTRGVDYVSAALTRITGYTPEELYADPDLVFEMIHPDDRHLLEERITLGPTPAQVTLRWRRKDGGTIWMEQRETPIYDRSGNVVAIEGISRQVAKPGNGRPGMIRLLGGLRIDFAEQTVQVDGQPVQLSRSEFKLLACLTERPGHVFTRAELTRRLWQSPHAGNTHACETHIAALRKKIERRPHFPERIVTVRKRGYRYISN